MNLYLISQEQNNDYDTYDSAVVAAESEEKAKNIHPGSENSWFKGWHGKTWCSSPEQVSVKLLGRAKKGTKTGVILASFNAG